MHLLQKAALAALVARTSAQFATYSTDGLQYEVNIPSSTASGSADTIFFQLHAPSGTQWIGLGQGSQMAGANIFIVYAAGGGNVTLSPRSGTGNSQPSFNSAASVSLLEGSGVLSDGSMVANVRCDSCLSWSGGSMDPTDSNSAWIWAVKSGAAIDSADPTANLNQHDTMGTISLNLPDGTGGSSSNPFVAAAVNPSSAASASASGSGSAPTTAVSTQTIGSATVVVPVATATSSSTSSSGSSSDSSSGTSVMTNVDATRSGHAVVMSLVFLVLMPFAALTLYLPYTKKVPYIHAPLQTVSIILVIVGLVLGVRLAKPLELTGGYHQVIGYIIVTILLSAQPVLGLLQHLHFRKTGTRSGMGIAHRWLGRIVIIAGVVNGGLGFMQTGPVGSEYVPNYAPVLYSVIAAVVFLIYLTVLAWMAMRMPTARPSEKHDLRGYEMHPSSNDRQFRHDPQRYR